MEDLHDGTALMTAREPRLVGSTLEIIPLAEIDIVGVYGNH